MKVSVPEEFGVDGPFDMASVATEVWAPGRLQYTQEPIFVPRAGGAAEDDGWVLLLVYNGETLKTELCILDAQRIADGEETETAFGKSAQLAAAALRLAGLLVPSVCLAQEEH